MIDIAKLSAHEIRDMVSRKEITAQEILDLYFRQIEKCDSKVGGYVRLLSESAYGAAKKVDEKVAQGLPVGLLAGVPIAIKDNMVIKGEEVTCASKILEGYRSPYDATVIKKIGAQDGIVIGKANLDEFAMGSSTENSCYNPTHNPWDLERVPGGSSGGSAAIIAAREAALALGSDTGGSIRQPASLCGVIGMKPTYGRVSRYGLVAFASSLDQIGPFAHNMKDCALMLNVISGYDASDSTSIKQDVPNYLESLEKSVKGLKVGVPKEYFQSGLDKGVSAKIHEAINVLQSLGVELVDISLPHTEYAIATYYIIATAEASSNLARYDGVQYGYRSAEDSKDALIGMYKHSRSKGFGAEVKRRIMLGTYVLSSGYYDAYYLKAQRVRTLMIKDFEDAFKKCDCIITPTSPTCAFKIGEKSSDPLEMYLSDICTISANLAGIPALSVPCGFVDNLPVGLQLLGKYLDEETLLRVGSAFELNTDYHCKIPDIVK